MKKLILLLSIITLSYASVGKISAIRGDALVVSSNGNSTKAILNQELDESDIIKTLDNARLQIIFSDNTITTLGKNTTLEIKQYLIDGKNSKVNLEVNEGSFKVITGEISKLARNNFKLKAHTATIGIRGTIFIGEISNNVNKLACLQGAIDVRVGNQVVVIEAGKQVNTNKNKLGQSQEINLDDFTFTNSEDSNSDFDSEQNSSQSSTGVENTENSDKNKKTESVKNNITSIVNNSASNSDTNIPNTDNSTNTDNGNNQGTTNPNGGNTTNPDNGNNQVNPDEDATTTPNENGGEVSIPNGNGNSQGGNSDTSIDGELANPDNNASNSDTNIPNTDNSTSTDGGNNQGTTNPDGGNTTNPDSGNQETTNPDSGNNQGTTNPDNDNSQVNPDENGNNQGTTNPDESGDENKGEVTNPDENGTTNPDSGNTTNPDNSNNQVNPDGSGNNQGTTNPDSENKVPSEGDNNASNSDTNTPSTDNSTSTDGGNNQGTTNPNGGNTTNPDSGNQETINPDNGNSQVNPDENGNNQGTTNPDGSGNENNGEVTNPDENGTTNPDSGNTANPDNGNSQVNPDGSGNNQGTTNPDENNTTNPDTNNGTNDKLEEEKDKIEWIPLEPAKKITFDENNLTGNYYYYSKAGTTTIAANIDFDNKKTTIYEIAVDPYTNALNSAKKFMTSDKPLNITIINNFKKMQGQIITSHYIFSDNPISNGKFILNNGIIEADKNSMTIKDNTHVLSNINMILNQGNKDIFNKLELDYNKLVNFNKFKLFANSNNEFALKLSNDDLQYYFNDNNRLEYINLTDSKVKIQNYDKTSKVFEEKLYDKTNETYTEDNNNIMITLGEIKKNIFKSNTTPSTFVNNNYKHWYEVKDMYFDYDKSNKEYYYSNDITSVKLLPFENYLGAYEKRNLDEVLLEISNNKLRSIKNNQRFEDINIKNYEKKLGESIQEMKANSGNNFINFDANGTKANIDAKVNDIEIKANDLGRIEDKIKIEQIDKNINRLQGK
ncbi:FecR domain-containing protein [Campylobacter sp. MG1]|uniref:FecR domain-containing protein n=1 Tax=Campylobacter sp. MG1 TaxID=2976332 RepID=UPI00226CC526|nr:FecR domain-containing protein [Campylobacter sp. MG1]